MDSNLIAIVAIIATLLSPFIGTILHLYFTNKHFSKVGKKRTEGISGTWKGKYKYLSGITPINENKDLDIEITLKFIGKKVEGKAKYKLGDGSTRSQVLKGGFYNTNILKLSYTGEADYSTRVGEYIGSVSPDLETMEGCIVGFGTNPEGIFSASFKIYNIGLCNLSVAELNNLLEQPLSNS